MPRVAEADLRLLRVGTDGIATSIKLGEYPIRWDANCYGTIVDITNAYVITNADQGVLASWSAKTGTLTSAGRNYTSPCR